MVPKGNQRGGGRQLATHLMNSYDNERVEVLDMRGAAAQDLHGAFAEWHAQSRGTKCVKYLYSLSINPDHRQQDVEHEHYLDYISRTEKRLGLAEQPRAVVVHVKNGREHYHVVWSRIDMEKGIAVQIAYDRQKLREVTQEYALEHGIELPERAKKDHGKDRHEHQEVERENLGEQGQEKRTGISKADRSRDITQAWTESDGGKSFTQALADKGYHIAQGRKTTVVVDRYGEVHSLSRQIKGVNAKILKERLNGVELRPVSDIQTEVLQTLEREQEQQKNNEQRHEQEKANEERRTRFEKEQAERREALDREDEALINRHGTERVGLLGLQASRRSDFAEQRAKTQPKGLNAFLQRVTGIQWQRDRKQAREDRNREDLHQQQLTALEKRHEHERSDLVRRRRDLAQIEARERQSLEADLRRDSLPRDREAIKEVARENTIELKETFRRTKPELEIPAKEIAGVQAKEPAIEPDKQNPHWFSGLFTRLAARLRPAQDFEKQAEPEKTEPVKAPEPTKSEVQPTYNQLENKRNESRDITRGPSGP